MTNVTDSIFGTRGAPPQIEDGRLIAKPVPILTIAPDLRQPRRAIPASVRGEWDGTPDDVPMVLGDWHAIVEERLGREIDLFKLLSGDGDDEVKHDDPVVESYLELARLAASIQRDGLINPVRVVRHAKGTVTHLIESGERRWLAYWLLSLHANGDYGTIPAIERPKIDVWAQAAENGARRPLNAIGMARQLALLVMDMYEHEDGVSFESYDALVLPGECDRKYYAQVANGNVFRIKRGFGERVIAATGLTSIKQISDYRALLSIPDALWQKADDQNWTENAIRDYVSAQKAAQTGDTLPTGNVSTKPVTASVSGFNRGDWVRTADGREGQVESTIGIYAQIGSHIGMVEKRFLTRIDAPAEAQPEAPDIASLYPEDTYVFHLTDGRLGVVRGHLLPTDEVVVADPLLPDTQTLQTWKAESVRKATPAEIEALHKHAQQQAADDGDGLPEPRGDGEEVNPFSIGDRVQFDDGRTGTVRYLKGLKCGVYKDDSGATHYYYWQDLRRIEDAPEVEEITPARLVLEDLYDTQSESGDWVPLMHFVREDYSQLASFLVSGYAVELLRVVPSGGLAKWYQITPVGCERLGLEALPVIPEPPADQYPGQAQIAAPEPTGDASCRFPVGDVVWYRERTWEITQRVVRPTGEPNYVLDGGTGSEVVPEAVLTDDPRNQRPDSIAGYAIGQAITFAYNGTRYEGYVVRFNAEGDRLQVAGVSSDGMTEAWMSADELLKSVERAALLNADEALAAAGIVSTPAPLYSDAATPALAQPALPTTALIDDYQNATEVGDALRFLKRQRNASPALGVSLQELLTVSQADIAQYLAQQPGRDDVWRLYLEEVGAQIVEEMTRLGVAINDYLKHLHDEGEALRGE